MSESIEFDSVEWITAGAVGEPGQRTFYLQARQGERVVAVLLEKGQVAAFADLAQELLARFEVTVMPDDLDEAHHRLVEGVEPLWRVGEMGLGASPDGERFMLEAHEVGAEEPATARFWMTRPQLVRLAAYAAWAVESGGRERCRLCGRPIDPVEGHVCPASNGHGKLTV
jgi:uncharacterized repeat protein (TIGR03847 family)